MVDDPALAATLTAALADDPFYRAILVGGGPAEQRGRLTSYFAHSLVEGRSVGMVDTTDAGRSGGSVWTPPVGTPGAEAAAAAKRERLRVLLMPAGWAVYTTIEAFFHDQVAGRLPADAWYLSILGVAPERHGAGLGSQLVQAGLQRIDAEGRPAYVETFNPRSVPFYERHGFAITATAIEPTTGQTYWLMQRRPSSTR